MNQNEEKVKIGFMLKSFIFVTLALFVAATAGFVFTIFRDYEKPHSADTPVEFDETYLQAAAQGKELLQAKGCIACHSLDGSPRVGPTLKGLFGRETQVVDNNGQEKSIVADEDYIRRSIMSPNAEIVKGYNAGQMVLISPVNEQEVFNMIAYFRTQAAEEKQEKEVSPVEQGKELVQAKACITCHSTDGSARVAPTFAGMFGKEETVITQGKEHKVKVDEEYIRRSIIEPDADIVKNYHDGMMPKIKIGDNEIKAIIAYLKDLQNKQATPAEATSTEGAAPITMTEMKKASQIYFDRCAGCHGMLRRGATGPPLLPENLSQKFKGTAGIKAVVNYGLPGGMPAWGKSGVLNEEEIMLLSRFLQHDPPDPAEMSLADMKQSWKVHIPVDERPTEPEHGRNWENFFGVVLRDAGKVAIIDGDTKELVNIINTGFAVHILRSSATGRYFYSIGRDGKVTLIDLWMKKPDRIAEVKVCYDARSVESSKYHGPEGDFRDKYVVVGGYWPPSFVIMDGQTLEPLKVVSTSSYTSDTYEFLREARVAAIVASHHHPEWVINVKETGYVWLVDYRDIDNLSIIKIEAERYLHDGGWDASKRYVLMAANARDTIAVIDTVEKKLAGLVKTGSKPHPGRGANIDHPKYGPIWCTGHLGDNTIACIGTDPENHPDNAWKVVKTIKLPGTGGGNLFIKTHPNSKWLWADRTLHPDAKLSRSVFVINKETLEFEKTIEIPAQYPGKAVHMEYNVAGDEIWVSAWSGQENKSGILIYDEAALELKHEITGDWVVTPTGKFNVYNTTKDNY